MLKFRDWLRSNSDNKLLNENVKRELVGRTWYYVQQYADAKTVVIDEIMARSTTKK